MWVIYSLSQHQLFKKDLSLYCYLFYFLLLNLNISISQCSLANCDYHPVERLRECFPPVASSGLMASRLSNYSECPKQKLWIAKGKYNHLLNFLYLALKFKLRKSKVFISNVNLLPLGLYWRCALVICTTTTTHARTHTRPVSPATTPLVTYALDTSVFL
jgi:hypothetical protein